MRLLGRRSLSSVFKVVADGLFYLVCVVLLVLMVLVVVVARVDDRSNVSVSLPVWFQLADGAYQITSTADGNVVATLNETRGDIQITGGSLMAVEVPLLGVAVLLGVALVVLYRLRRIFRRLVQGQPFLEENVRGLRIIGLAVVAGALLAGGLEYLGQRVVAADLVSAELVFEPAFNARVPVLLAGLVLLIVAEVFHEGFRMRADLETARTIQFSLVADARYRNGSIAIDSRMEPAAEVGGDYYDVIDLDDGRIAFVVADVAGKGLPAAMLMTLLRGSLRSLIAAGLRGAALVNALNIHLVTNTPDNRMITLFYGELDPDSGRLIYVNAGHNPPYLLDASGRRPLDATAMVLGMIEGAPFTAAEAELGGGARLLLFTDGVTEAANPAGEEFGEARLEHLLDAERERDPAAVIAALVGQIGRFCGTAKQYDDMTMMLISRAGGAPAEEGA